MDEFYDQSVECRQDEIFRLRRRKVSFHIRTSLPVLLQLAIPGVSGFDLVLTALAAMAARVSDDGATGKLLVFVTLDRCQWCNNQITRSGMHFAKAS